VDHGGVTGRDVLQRAVGALVLVVVVLVAGACSPGHHRPAISLGGTATTVAPSTAPAIGATSTTTVPATPVGPASPATTAGPAATGPTSTLTPASAGVAGLQAAGADLATINAALQSLDGQLSQAATGVNGTESDPAQ
jgi:hypothetical protein